MREKTYTSSDQRLKKDIKQISGALDSLMQIRGVSYLRRDYPLADREIGVIAQEVRKVLPEIVYEMDRTKHANAYSPPQSPDADQAVQPAGEAEPVTEPAPGTEVAGTEKVPPAQTVKATDIAPADIMDEGFEYPDITLAVDYPRLVPLLIEAIKEQQSQIKALRERIDKIE